jgi:general secretion pathway protein G
MKYWRRYCGFTLIELMVVMAIIAVLLSLAVPKYFHSVEKSREAVLKEDLGRMREALDKYYGDVGKYPDTLDDLVTRKYLRKIPQDPITESDASWVSVAPEKADMGNVYDIKSGATGVAIDGTAYADW